MSDIQTAIFDQRTTVLTSIREHPDLSLSEIGLDIIGADRRSNGRLRFQARRAVEAILRIEYARLHGLFAK